VTRRAAASLIAVRAGTFTLAISGAQLRHLRPPRSATSSPRLAPAHPSRTPELRGTQAIFGISCSDSCYGYYAFWGKACARYLLEAVLDDGSGLLRSAALMADFGTTSAEFVVGCGGPSACQRPGTADQEVAS
jgi:hypothetical protein